MVVSASPSESGEPPITAPTFDEVVCRLDVGNLVAVLEAMQLRKGLNGPPFSLPSPAEEKRERLSAGGISGLQAAEDLNDQIAEDAARQISHDEVVCELRDRLVDQLRAVALALETQDVTGGSV